MASATPEQLQQLLADLESATKCYNPASTLDAAYSRIAIRDKAKKLLLAVTTPDDMAWQKCLNMVELVALRLSIKWKVFPNIPLQGSISSSDLSKAVGVNQSMLERVLRVLVGTGILDQVTPDGGDYKHTKFSEGFIIGPGPGPGIFIQAMFDEYLKTNVRFDEYLDARFSAPYPEPISNDYNSYNWRHGKEGQSAWITMASYPERMAAFQAGLVGLDASVPAVGPFYDFSQLKSDDPNRIELVDVGGGHGRVLKEILQATPALDPKKCVLQDQEAVLQGARESKMAPEDVQLMAIDFHTEQPVKGAMAYNLRFITHDYSDETVTNILSHIGKAMAPDSRLLLGDQVIPERVDEATVNSTIIDQMMLCIGGKERTEEGFRSIMDKAGIELVRVHRMQGSTGAIVEGRVKQ